MTNPDEFTTETAAEAAMRIGAALKDQEMRTNKGARITFSETMALYSTPAASILFEDAPTLPANKFGGYDQ